MGEEKKTTKKKIEEIELDDLVDALVGNIEEDCVDFTDVVNLQGYINREIHLGEVEDSTGRTIDGLIRFWNNYDKNNNIPVDEREPIKIIIDSPGGSLTDAFTAIDAIQLSETPVYTYAIGCAYSAGFFIFISGHKRYAYPRASFLFHEGSAGNSGTASQFENFTEFYKRQLKQLKDLVLDCTDIGEEKYKEIKKEDYWMDTADAIKWGVADDIVTRLP